MSAQRDFLAGGGEMGALMRAKDWAATPLGPVESWPQSLRTAVSILLNSRYPMFIFWGPRLIKIYNDGYRPITGEKHPRVLGLPGTEVWPEIWADIGPMVERVMRHGEATWSEDLRLYMHRRGFAEEVYFTFSYSPIRDESGGIGGMFCACTETTAKVLGERRLKLLRDLAAEPRQARSAEEARALSLAVLRANPADVADARIGADGELALAPSPNLAFDEEYRGFFDLVRRQVAASVAAATAVEAERLRAEKLAEIDRAKTAFFSNVSHEFRTPLTLMLGPLEDGLADAAAPLPPAQRERLELARRSGLRLQKLVNTLLDFSRIEAGRAQASYAPTDLAALTADLASTFRSTMEKAGLALSVDCPPLASPAYVDREMWEKIVLNLLSNAFKFTFEGGVAVSLRETAGGIELEVRDTGTGIPAAHLSSVFERFRRVEGARSRTHEGTGIGLALVRELVHLHGGTIEARSREGEGSVFTVRIAAGSAHLPPDRIGAPRSLPPTVVAADAFVEEAERWLPGAPPEQPAARATRPRIVWADDNADMREYVRKLLAPHYEVHAVADGEAALEAIRNRAPDLVLADIMMPRLDGLGLLAAVRAQEATRTLPVVLLSARAGEEARIEALRAGADDYVAKPFSARELLARISARIELSRMAEQMRREQADLDRLFAQVPVPTAIIGGPDLVFQTCNAAYIEAVGGRDIVGRPLAQALPELDGQGFDALLREVMRTGVPHIGRETRVRIQRNGNLEDAYFTFIYAPLRSADGTVDRVIAICNDVTEQVLARAHIERLAAEARGTARELEDFVENATVAMHWVGPDGTILWANRAELEMLGYAREDYVGRNIADFHASREAIRDILERLHRDEKLENYEAALVRKDGTLRHVLINSSVRWQDGRFLHTQCFTRDITERKAAEDALRHSEARYRDIFEAAGVSIWEEDFTAVIAFVEALRRQGVTDFRAHLEAHPHIVREAVSLVQVVDVNPASLRLFGAARKEELLDSLERIFTPESEAVFREEMVALAEGRPRYEGEAVLRTLAGERREMQLCITFPQPGAPANKVLVTLTDITARKQAERRLERELAAARRLQETSVRLLEQDDPATIYGHICEAAREIMGSQFSSMQMLHPERGAKGELRLLAMRGFAAEAQKTWEWVRADSTCSCGEALRTGRRVVVADVETEAFMAGTQDQRALLAAGIRAAQSTPLVARDGSMLGMITTHWTHPHAPAEQELRLLDVLARQAADLIERSKALQALLEADRRKDEFLAILSHELRNPLAPIRNAVTLLRADDDALRREALPVLERQVAHLIRLVDDLLDVSRINRGDIVLQKRVVALAEIVASAVETSRPIIDARGHRLELQQGEAPAAVFGDPVRLAQVVANLLNNAAAYTPAGGRIDVAARAENGRAVIRVRDTGPGIAPEAAQGLFELFSRGEAARNHPSGFGVGLALARRLVEMHGGTIEVSSPGVGSEFVVRLPLEEAQRPAGGAREGAPGIGGKRVLIVDDNVDAADSLGMVLRTLGARVKVVNDGTAALEAFEAEDPAVVLLDIGMPGMNGYEVARAIRSRFPAHRAALVALTGWGQETDRRRAEQAGFDHHLVKPADLVALQELLAGSDRAAR